MWSFHTGGYVFLSEWHVSSQIQLQNTSSLIQAKDLVVLRVIQDLSLSVIEKNKLQDRIDNANNLFDN